MGCCTSEGKTCAHFFLPDLLTTITEHNMIHLINTFICTNQPNYNKLYTEKCLRSVRVSVFLKEVSSAHPGCFFIFLDQKYNKNCNIVNIITI